MTMGSDGSHCPRMGAAQTTLHFPWVAFVPSYRPGPAIGTDTAPRPFRTGTGHGPRPSHRDGMFYQNTKGHVLGWALQTWALLGPRSFPDKGITQRPPSCCRYLVTENPMGSPHGHCCSLPSSVRLASSSPPWTVWPPYFPCE